MADYLLMVLENEAAHASQSPKAMAELIERRAQFVDGLRRAGQLRDCGRLRASEEGKRVRHDGERLQIESGPFAEDGKAFAAYYWVEAQSVEAAAALAAACPRLASDEVDLRPLMKGKVEHDKEGKPGKIFALAVIGNAPTEDVWTALMDRIDAESTGFPADSFLGGLRLQPPTTGRRIATHGERRAMFDGPFLESKEVIGGVCFLRVKSMDEAVRLAGENRAIRHGALEIRELWRS